MKCSLPTDLRKFSPSKVSHYTVCGECVCVHVYIRVYMCSCKHGLFPVIECIMKPSLILGRIVFLYYHNNSVAPVYTVAFFLTESDLLKVDWIILYYSVFILYRLEVHKRGKQNVYCTTCCTATHRTCQLQVLSIEPQIYNDICFNHKLA